MENNVTSRVKREKKSRLLHLAMASVIVAVTGGAIMTVATSPIVVTSISSQHLTSNDGTSLMLNPAFKQPRRAQSVKTSRLLTAKNGQGRAKQMSENDIRRSYLKPKLKKAGQAVLVASQRELIDRQIADNAASEIALIGQPQELQVPSKPVIAEGRPPLVPSTAIAAIKPSNKRGAASKNPFKLVLQGADDSKLPPGQIPVPAKRPAGLALAYASFGHDGFDQLFEDVPAQTSKVAVYDIAAGKVFMPDGEVMEAHSGRGKYRDNPKYTHVQMAGAVPAATYKLSMRESLFHGVPAIRMTSVDGTNPLGRTGILAHTYMLRTPGDSHGCLVFKDYYKFLKSFKKNKVDYIVAVPSLEKGVSHELASRSL